VVCRGFRSGTPTRWVLRICYLVALGWIHAVPDLSFTGAPIGDDTKLEGTVAAVAQLGDKADAARLVAIVEAELARQDGVEVLVVTAVVIAAQARR
jgi:hypothetical protein